MAKTGRGTGVHHYHAVFPATLGELRVGDILTSSQVGRVGYGKFIYAVCPRCGVPRLVAYSVCKNAPTHKYCRTCASKVAGETAKGHLPYNSVLLRNRRELSAVLADPHSGDLIHGSDLGKSGVMAKIVYRWMACPYCGKNPRWVVNHVSWRSRRCRLCANSVMREVVQKPLRTKKNKWGYILVFVRPSDPYFSMVSSGNRVPLGRGVGGYLQEHRLVMARYLGRCLERWEQIHHLNGIKTDNRIENLELLSPRMHTANTALQSEVYRLRRRVVELEAQVQSLRRGL